MASAAEPDVQGLIGAWAMQGGADDSWSEIGEQIESIDERGRSGGTYCPTRDDQSIFAFELRPNEVKGGDRGGRGARRAPEGS